MPPRRILPEQGPKIKKQSRAALDTLASTGKLIPDSLYFITPGNVLALATTASTYIDIAVGEVTVPEMTLSGTPSSTAAGAPISFQPIRTNGVGPFLWSMVVNSVPTGFTSNLSINSSTGLITGTVSSTAPVANPPFVDSFGTAGDPQVAVASNRTGWELIPASSTGFATVDGKLRETSNTGHLMVHAYENNSYIEWDITDWGFDIIHMCIRCNADGSEREGPFFPFNFNSAPSSTISAVDETDSGLFHIATALDGSATAGLGTLRLELNEVGADLRYKTFWNTVQVNPSAPGFDTRALSTLSPLRRAGFIGRRDGHRYGAFRTGAL